MPLRILITLNQVQESLASGVLLDYPVRCSRCNAAPADYYESHNLRLRIGRKRPGLYRQAYRINQPYRLQIRICETCYRADFTTNIEEMEKDATPQGKLARLYRRVYTIGGAVACLGLFLMTNFIHPDSNLGNLKMYWPYIVGAGGFIIIAAWLHQRYRMSQVRDELEAAGVSLESRLRADVHTPVLDDDQDPRGIPLEIGFRNDAWAEECAAHYNFTTEGYTPGIKIGDE